MDYKELRKENDRLLQRISNQLSDCIQITNEINNNLKGR